MMNKNIIKILEINTETQTIIEINEEDIYDILKKYEYYNDGYFIINKQIENEICETIIYSGDGIYILEIYTLYEPYIDKLDYYKLL